MTEPAPEGGWIRRLWPFLAVHKRDVFIALLASAVGQAANGIGPIVQKVVVDDGIVHHTRSVTPWLILLGALAAVTFGLAFVRRWVGGRVSLGVQHDLRTAIFDRLMRLRQQHNFGVFRLQSCAQSLEHGVRLG